MTDKPGAWHATRLRKLKLPCATHATPACKIALLDTRMGFQQQLESSPRHRNSRTYQIIYWVDLSLALTTARTVLRRLLGLAVGSSTPWLWRCLVCASRAVQHVPSSAATYIDISAET